MGLPVQSAGALLLGALSIAALHALIPSHWLAFAVVGRARRWTMRRTLGTTALAGTGHTLATVILGVTLSAISKAAHSHELLPPWLEHFAAAGSLLLLGLYFVFSSLLGRKTCHHDHSHGDDDLESVTDPAGTPRSTLNRTAMGTLVLGMTLSPCLDLLPVYLAAASLSWSAILLISIAMTATTLTVMVGLVWLAMHGLMRLKLRWLEHHEGLAVGGILVALGLLLLFQEGLHLH